EMWANESPGSIRWSAPCRSPDVSSQESTIRRAGSARRRITPQRALTTRALGAARGAQQRLTERREVVGVAAGEDPVVAGQFLDRKSTRLNSSHVSISYAVFCLKTKNNKYNSS